MHDVLVKGDKISEDIFIYRSIFQKMNEIIVHQLFNLAWKFDGQ